MILLDQLLIPGSLETHVQPIVSFSGPEPRLQLLECLTRGPAGTNLRQADVLFEYVRRKGAEIPIDRVCIRNALAAAATLPGQPDIAVNVHASTLAGDARFTPFLLLACEEHAIVPSRLTLEITEHAAAADGRQFLETLETLRALGIRIALDDIGIGISNYKMILDVEPDLFKIDGYVVRGCATDRRRFAIIDTLHQLALRLGGAVVVEGVENEEDLEAALAIGATLAQGFLIARPVPASEFTAWLPVPVP